MNTNAAQIMLLENKLQAIPRKAAQPAPNGGASDPQAIQNSILDLKQKNNDLYARGDALATQLKQMGRDADHPQPSHGPAGAGSTPPEPPVDAAVPADKPLQKQDIGDVATADVNAFPPEIIPLKPVTVHTQTPPPGPVASIDKAAISPPVPPVQIDPAAEQAIDEQVRRQKPVVDALFAPPVAPEPPPVVAVAPVAPAEPPPQVEPPTTDWGTVLLGTLIVGGAIAGGVAASSSSDGGYSAPSGGYGGGGHGGHGGGGYGGGAVHCH
ncbi:MAG TPA: hypothetical protein VEU51_06510 [Candidatus Acidoferrales bacterium]|nr:hypothetical protein [Candidatus Acidoferrales bacterium]